jgi:hypothetical protein
MEEREEKSISFVNDRIVKKEELNDNDNKRDKIDEDKYDDDTVSKMAENEYIENVVMEQVIKFIKTDDLIRKKNKEHREQMKVLKKDKTDMESFLINFLDKNNEKNIIIENSNTKLKLAETKHKECIKLDNIRKSVMEELKREKLVDSENRINKIIDDLFVIIESNRKVVSKPCIRRYGK